MSTRSHRLPARLAFRTLFGLLIAAVLLDAAPAFAASPGVAAGFQIDGNLVATTGFVDWYQGAGGVGTGVLYRKTDSTPCAPVDALTTHFERDPSWAQG